jgi:flagellar protein FlaG
MDAMMINPVVFSGQTPSAPGKSVAPGQPPTPIAPPASPTKPVDEAQLKRAVTEANIAARSLSSSIEFSVDQQSGKTIVKVVDSQTQKLIRQMPSEEMIEISLALDRMQGMLLRRKA